MEFRVLGSLEVVDGGRTVELGGTKRRAVLALLLLHANEVVGRDRLIDELWGESPPRNAHASLHNHVSRLRKELGPDVVATKPWGYVLRADPDSIDLERFRRLVTSAEQLPAKARAEKLAEALALWRGNPLEDLAFEPGLADEISQLEELRLAVLERRTDADLEVGRHGEVVGELEGLIARNPLREHLRAQLILALYRSGRQAEALEVYRETRRVLAEELGLEPSPELRELEKAILRQDPALTAEPASPPPEEPATGGSPATSSGRRRRLLLVAAAAVLLAMAVAAAVAASWHREARKSPVAAKGAAPPASAVAAQHRSRKAAPTASKHPGTVSHRRAPLTHVKKARARPQRALRPQPVPSASPPAIARPKQRVRVKRKRAPTKRALIPKQPSPQVRIADAFSDGTIDRQLWYQLPEAGSELKEANGRLELAIHADAVPGGEWNQVSAQLGTHCHFAGNFDARVDFELLRWPDANGAYLQLDAFFDSGGANVGRSGVRDQGYASWIPPHGTVTTSGDQKGRLRLRRVGGVLSGYYWQRRRWVLLERAAAPGYANVALQLFAPAASFGHVEIAAAFDNFVVKGTGDPSTACPAA